MFSCYGEQRRNRLALTLFTWPVRRVLTSYRLRSENSLLPCEVIHESPAHFS
jgi:hypothetical protein